LLLWEYSGNANSTTNTTTSKEFGKENESEGGFSP
jgi:hypothetical protein